MTFPGAGAAEIGAAEAAPEHAARMAEAYDIVGPEAPEPSFAAIFTEACALGFVAWCMVAGGIFLARAWL